MSLIEIEENKMATFESDEKQLIKDTNQPCAVSKDEEEIHIDKNMDNVEKCIKDIGELCIDRMNKLTTRIDRAEKYLNVVNMRYLDKRELVTDVKDIYIMMNH